MLADDTLLPRLHYRPIELGRAAIDAKFLAVVYKVINLGVKKQCLGRDTADIQTGAAQPVILLDNRGLQTPLRRADGRNISPRATAQDY